MHIFFSTGHPFRSSGPDLLHLSRPSQRVSFDNEATWKMGARWIEATHKAKDGKLYMWYHNEPPLPAGGQRHRRWFRGRGPLAGPGIIVSPAGSNKTSANYYSSAATAISR
jgi:hypothetical protein